MSSSEVVAKIADQIRRALPNLKIGTLRFWGVWFGRPYDNLHKVVRCDVEGEVLRLYFDGGETLTVWSARGLVTNKSTFEICDADRVRWEWFYYGRERVDSNLRFYDFVRSPEGITASTNAGWYDSNRTVDLSKPAVEIL